MVETLGEMQRRLNGLAEGDVMNVREMIKLELLSSFAKYVKVMFKQQYQAPFIMNSHFERIFEALQDVVDGKCNRLIINMPPRYGKTEAVVKQFVDWCFALNPRCRFLHLSYSDTLVFSNSEAIRMGMQTPLYKELFPESKLKREKGSAKLWATDAGGQFYAVPTKGQVTGFGAGNVEDPDADLDNKPIFDIPEVDEVLHQMGAYSNVFQGAILIDDPLKPDDAESDLIRETVNRRFENTIRSRVNSSKTPIIIIMQRLHEHDLCGYLLEVEPKDWRVLSLPALSVDPETGEEHALWEFKHTVDELHKKREIDPIIFETQYQQNPTPREGLMYDRGFGTYTPEMLEAAIKANRYKRAKAYIDTADEGKDYLAAFCFIDTPEYIYITDCLVTQDPMEITEPGTAELLTRNRVRDCRIESNNGGRAFARAVKRLLRTQFHNSSTTVWPFTQTLNKNARIFTNSASVQNDILFPEGWETDKRWANAHKALTSYRKEGKNAHDDVPDALTGVWETHAKGIRKPSVRRAN